jgi:cardiolipin synthase
VHAVKKLHPALLAVIFVAGVLATIVALNFTSGEKKVRQELAHHYDVADAQFLRSMGVLLGPALVDGNRVDTLLNGDEIFPAMLRAIRSASKTITFETYIYWSGDIGREFADALSERARSGVRVHVMLDWVGSQKMDEASLDKMRKAGVEIVKYHPPRWYTLNRLNNRTHRKLLVVDGTVGFTGGVGIADKWTGHAQDKDHWRDTHYRVEGPAAAQMQAAFTDNWTEVTGRVLHTAAYFPPQKPAGTQLAQVFQSSSEGGAESMQLMYLLSVAAARSTIDLSMAYFVPDEIARDTLVAALHRGVRIRIILPGPFRDAVIVSDASHAGWGDLLKNGAQIYEYQPTMYHCKVLVVDGLWTSVGSTNFDSRSFQLNDEANLNVYDRRFAERQTAVFDEDLKHSRRVTYEEWLARPWTQKVWQKALTVFNTQW